MNRLDSLYTFVYRGILTDASLDKVGRRRNRQLRAEEAAQLTKSLSLDFLDQDLLVDSQRMAIVYSAIHAFENTVRQLVMKAMAESHGETWWEKIPEKITKKVQIRMEEDAKFRWHGTRGSSEIIYCDFGDLSSIINANWPLFEGVLANLEWVKQLLNTLEKSRNIIMHGGNLEDEDIERIGMYIRDWIRQAG
jgi:hypothetical protein